MDYKKDKVHQYGEFDDENIISEKNMVDEKNENNGEKSYFHSFKGLVIIGIIFYFLSSIIKAFCPRLEVFCIEWIGFSNPVWFVSEFCDIMHEGSIAIFISATLIFALETNHYKSYFTNFFEERVINLLMKDSYIEKLDNYQLKELRKKAESKLLFINRPYDESGLWSFLTKRLSHLIEDVYFIEYEMKTTISVKKLESEARVFYVRTHKSLVVKNPTNRTIEYKIPVNSCGRSIDGLVNEKLYYIQRAEVNGEELKTGEIEVKENQSYKTGKSPYDLRFECKSSTAIESGKSCKIDIDVISVLPESDNIITSTVIHPCKRYRVDIYLDTDEFTVDANAFTFNDKGTDYHSPHKSENEKVIEIDVDDWLLPGEGVSVILREKNKLSDLGEKDLLPKDFYKG